MKILVFDDNPIHRHAAEVMLSGHELTIVSTYREAEDALRVKWVAKEKVYPDFDVVLTDLLVPVNVNEMPVLSSGADKFDGQEMPLGMMIAIRALSAKVKRVAVITDADHHSHPASAAMDWVEGFSAGDIKLLCNNYNVCNWVDKRTFLPVDIDFVYSEEGKKKYPNGSDDLILAKDWAEALRQLTE